MSKLEELIQQYCPDGVEWKYLGDFCEVKTGKGITKKDNCTLFIDATKECIKITNSNKLTEENIQNILDTFRQRT